MTAYLSKSSLNIEWAVGKFSLILKSGNVGFNHIEIGRCSGNRQLHWKWNRQLQCTLARKLESANYRPSIYVTNRTQQQELSVVKFLKLTICVCLRIFGCVIIRCYRRHNIISGVKILEFASDWSDKEAQDTCGTWWKRVIGHDAYFMFRWVEALCRDEREEKNWKNVEF